VTLLAALVYSRTWEITDALVTLLLRVVHAIGARADRKVTKQLVAEFKKVHGKENTLFRWPACFTELRDRSAKFHVAKLSCLVRRPTVSRSRSALVSPNFGSALSRASRFLDSRLEWPRATAQPGAHGSVKLASGAARPVRLLVP
jgi:hypothetical protein